MTLRSRLTAAFLVVVLGPVLAGALFVGFTVSTVSRDRSLERLDQATTAVRTAVAALCQQLHAVGETVAVFAAADSPRLAADSVVRRGLVSAVRVTDPSGSVALSTPGQPAGPWAECAGPPSAAGTAPRFGAVAAGVEVRDRDGSVRQVVSAVQALDEGLAHRLADGSGAAVTLICGAGTAEEIIVSTEAPERREPVAAIARGLGADEVGEADGVQRFVRRVGPAAGQPLSMVLSVPRGDPPGLYAGLVGAIVLGGLLAVGSAWSLARSTTRPLAELARAVERIGAGDLACRVPVRAPDEVGALSAAVNRMTRQAQAYVEALTAGRDQLRGQLAMLGDALSGTHDLNRILRVILHAALAVTGARAGVVLLLDPASGVLVGQCGQGLGGAGPAGLRVPLGSGVLGRVAATGVPRRGRAGADGAGLSWFEPRCRTYIAVPLAVPQAAAPGGTGGPGCGPPPVGAGPGWAGAPAGGAAERPGPCGVLALFDRLGQDEFDDSDLVTLRTFAGHAAVAVDNVGRHEEAQRLSLTDPLTGLWNYRYLRESIRREVERAGRFDRRLAVLALDLDRFKEVNDGHGHAAGDAVLVEFSRRLRAGIREVDLAFRQGGEEFVVLLPETDLAGAAAAAERLAAAIRDAPIVIDGPERDPVQLTITVSIGIAVFPDHAAGDLSVLDAADDALYAAKAAGRDTWRSADGPRPAHRSAAVEPARPARSGEGSPSGASPATHRSRSRASDMSLKVVAGSLRSVPVTDDHDCSSEAEQPRPAVGRGASDGPHRPWWCRGR